MIICYVLTLLFQENNAMLTKGTYIDEKIVSHK
jgi:hypothetical protein